MLIQKRVLIVGLDPDQLVLPDPHYGEGHWNASAIYAAIESGLEHLRARGYIAESCLTGRALPEAACTVEEHLRGREFDCIVIGAGVRVPEENFALFEAMVNQVHRLAPTAAIAFNTRPDDTEEAIRRSLEGATQDRR